MNVSKTHNTYTAEECRLAGLTAHTNDTAAMDHFAGALISNYENQTGFIGLDSSLTEYAMDSIPNMVTAPSTHGRCTTIATGLVHALTAKRSIDELLGMTNIGNWYDEEIITGILEHVGSPIEYSDLGHIPTSASWNVNYDKRTVVRHELGYAVGRLEAARQAASGINSADEKNKAATAALEINRNNIGWHGVRDGANKTYGLLNDPNLPAYIALPAGAASKTTWVDKSFAEICSDIRFLLNKLAEQSAGLIDPSKDVIKVAIPHTLMTCLSFMNENGVSVQDFLNKSFKNLQFFGCPELVGANNGANALYMFPDTITGDDSTDNGKVIEQLIPTRIMMLGQDNTAKQLTTDMVSASAGVLVKRPFGVVRATGL